MSNVQQQQKKDGNSNKRPRSVRSCVSCRSSKQRCELPSAAQVIPSAEAQPSHLACRRCQILQLDCIVSAPLPKSARIRINDGEEQPQQQQQQPRQQKQQKLKQQQDIGSSSGSSSKTYKQQHPSPSSNASPYRQHQHISSSSSNSNNHNDHTNHNTNNTYNHSSHSNNSSRSNLFHNSIVTEQQDGNVSSSRPSEPSPGSRFYHTVSHEMQILDPIPVLASADSGTPSMAYTSSDNLDLLLGRSWIDRARIACRPIRLLDHLLSTSFKPAKRKLETPKASGKGKLVDLLEVLFAGKGAEEHYQESIATLQKFVPFLPGLSELLEAGSGAHFLLATCLTLAPTTNERNNLALAGSLVQEIEQRVLSCMLRPSQQLFDTYALTLVAIYHPQILSNLASSGASIDGAGFLAAAAHAARMLGFERALLHLNGVVHHNSHFISTTSSTVRNAVFWLYLGLQSTLNCLYTSIDGQSAVSLTHQELSNLQQLCEAAIEDQRIDRSEKSRWSSILVLTFRAQATRSMYEICAKLIVGFKGRNDPTERGARIATLVNVSIKADEEVEDLVLHLVKEMKRLCIFLESHSLYDDTIIDWIEMEIAFLRFLCFSHFTEELFVRATSFVGLCSSSGEFLSRLLAEPVLMKAYERTGGRRANIAKHVLTLFANFMQRVTPSTTRILQGVSVVQWCSVIVMASKSIAEETAGRFIAGALPVGLLGSGAMESGLLLLHSVYDALCNLVPRRRRCSEDEEHLILTAAQSVQSTSAAILDWKARATGLTSLHKIRVGEDGNEDGTSKSQGRGGGGGYTGNNVDSQQVSLNDALLHDILSMPIDNFFRESHRGHWESPQQQPQHQHQHH